MKVNVRKYSCARTSVSDVTAMQVKKSDFYRHVTPGRRHIGVTLAGSHEQSGGMCLCVMARLGRTAVYSQATVSGVIRWGLELRRRDYYDVGLDCKVGRWQPGRRLYKWA